MNDFTIVLIIVLPVVAFLYASVGHGGASSYLVLLTLAGFAHPEIRSSALILNILVSGIAFLIYRRTCEFPAKLFTSLILFSIPAAFLGGMMTIDENLYRKILGVVLLFPILRLLNVFPVNENSVAARAWWMTPVIGLSIGFVSGLIGIGGGIILSPLLLMLGWTTIRVTSAVSALFILMNSISGLVSSGALFGGMGNEFFILIPLALAGGFAGAYYGANRFKVHVLKYLLATVLLIAATKFILA
jgi:uncharacterized membrane protein YfcA